MSSRGFLWLSSLGSRFKAKWHIQDPFSGGSAASERPTKADTPTFNHFDNCPLLSFDTQTLLLLSSWCYPLNFLSSPSSSSPPIPAGTSPGFLFPPAPCIGFRSSAAVCINSLFLLKISSKTQLGSEYPSTSSTSPFLTFTFGVRVFNVISLASGANVIGPRVPNLCSSFLLLVTWPSRSHRLWLIQ